MIFDDDNGPSMGEYEYMYALCNDPNEDAIYESSAIHPLEELPRPLDSVPPGKWRVRGGAVLEIKTMTDEHLRNAIRLFTHSGWGEHMKIQELWEELGRRATGG